MHSTNSTKSGSDNMSFEIKHPSTKCVFLLVQNNQSLSSINSGSDNMPFEIKRWSTNFMFLLVQNNQSLSSIHSVLIGRFWSKSWFDLIFGVLSPIQQYFSYIMATSFSGGRSQSTRREKPTMGKQLVNFIGCESSAPFMWIYKAGREPTPYWC